MCWLMVLPSGRWNGHCRVEEDQEEEEDHLTKALMKCNYPRWTLNRVRMKMNSTAHKNKNKAGPTQQNNTPRPHITVPYYRGLSESVKQRCKNYGVQVYFRGGTTIKNLLMVPKDLDPMMKKSGVIYSYKCGRVECNEEYIGESSRTFEQRFKEHQKAPSPIFDHFNTTGHSISVENFNIVGREDQNLKRSIKEALYIRVNNPSLNRNVGKYHLPHIWDEVLYNIPELKLKWTLTQGHNICPVVITSATYHPPPYSGHSICHLAIPSANTFNVVVITSATILAIKSAKYNYGRQ